MEPFANVVPGDGFAHFAASRARRSRGDPDNPVMPYRRAMLRRGADGPARIGLYGVQSVRG